MATCPFCKEEIADGAIKCKHCGEILEKDKFASTKTAQIDLRPKTAGLKKKFVEYFKKVHENDGRFTPGWTWWGFLFGPIWYLVCGMWAKSLLLIILSGISLGTFAPFAWIYAGVAGKYDYYILKVKGKQLW